ncbi:MAG: hypothetical protein ACI9H8_000119 [Lysobacterales bacterium]|jgi:hypothetical protein
MKTFKLPIAFCVLVLLSIPVLADDLDESRDVSPDATVSVSNVAGEITITVWDRNEVHLTGRMGSNQELKITENANGVQFEVINIGDYDNYDEAELQLTVPRGANIVAEGVSADITITGSKGSSINAESVSGDIWVEAESDRLELSSVSGSLEFEGSSSRSSAESVSGDIDLAGLSGEIVVSTVSGDVNLNAGDIELGKFETVSGSLELRLALSDGGKLTVEGMSGDVDLYLPSTQSGEFGAQTFSGDISSKFGSPNEESFGPGSHLKHSQGDSGAVIRVETFSGDIRIGHK